MVQMLGRLPSAETLQYLDELKNEADAAKILSTLRGGLTSKQPEADTSTRAPNTDINDPINATTSSPGWQTPYPKAYPGIAGRYVDVFQTDSTYEVMESSTRDLDLPHADNALDPQTDQLAIFFCEEAEQHWMDERGKGNDSMIILAATEFLCLGYLGQGRDHSVLRYLTEAANMADRMALFTTEGPMDGKRITAHINTVGADKTALMYTAWGIFGWLTLMSLFYHQPGILCPKFPPRVPIPKRDTLDVSNGAFGHSTENVPSLPVYMGDTFTYLCRFWTIMREVSWVYHTQGQQPWGLSGASEFAEFKFRELLAWSNSLPDQLSAYEHSQHHHVQVMQASSFTFLWHTALIYVANALLQNEKGGNWYSCLLLCLYGYQKLSRSWRVAEAITKGILSMTLRKGDISSIAARRILLDFKNRTPDSISGGIRATFMVDLDRALSEPSSATVEYLASQFEGNAILDEYTNIFDNSKRREER
ncbi:hypothetical protein QQS21_002285 [Conoideocrella luteorostrata]|uniref:Uncharacterized protein n=1 Tax=Conoideocrella luteorostrata TaxID=1105319 RepID=A0AAJ0CWG2_9HYPO|nr:hypothetical protein QQS21_002285 [Conoideocrella luteorostrata]